MNDVYFCLPEGQPINTIEDQLDSVLTDLLVKAGFTYDSFELEFYYPELNDVYIVYTYQHHLESLTDIIHFYVARFDDDTHPDLYHFTIPIQLERVSDYNLRLVNFNEIKNAVAEFAKHVDSLAKFLTTTQNIAVGGDHGNST